MTSTRPAVAAPRVSPGVPSGGQFAAHGHTETDVVLAEEPRTPTAAPPTTAELFEQAQRSGKFWSRRLGVDAEDLCQSAMLAYFEADASRERKQDSDSASAPSGGVAENPRGYIHGASRNIASQMLNGKVRSEDQRAQVVFREREAEAEQKLNRRLTGDEADAIAAEISASMPPKRRPSAGFQRPRQLLPWDGLPQHTKVDIEHSVSERSSVEVNEQEFTAGSAGEQAEKLVAQGGRSGFVKARRLAYDVMAEKIGGPPVARGTVTEYSAQNSRKVLAESGGVREVVDAWRAGDATAEQEKALFVPFKVDGATSARKSVSATLVASGAYADDVWASAMTAATRPHARAPDAPAESTRAPAATRPHTRAPDAPDAPDDSGWFR